MSVCGMAVKHITRWKQQDLRKLETAHGSGLVVSAYGSECCAASARGTDPSHGFFTCKTLLEDSL